MLEVVGRTVDGKLVVAGIYRLYETHGIPFAVLFEALDQNKAIPSWVHYLREAQAAGVKLDRAIGKIEDALSDVWGREFREVVTRQLHRVVELGLVDPPDT